MLQVFDSWAGELSPYQFESFALPSVTRISTNLRRRLQEAGIPQVPLTLFAKGANTSLLAQTKAGYDTLGLDWVIEPSEARKIVGDGITLQGNVDPNVLYGGRDAIEREVKRTCESFKGSKPTKAWIANLGHGITPGVDPEDMKWFLECVHKYSVS